ncbi:MAG: sensor histidine kinase [Haloarculaceae archaeon]
MRDITDSRRHRQQLEVLNRVLRHNLRNKLTIVRGNIETASEQVDGTVSQLLEKAQDATNELLATSKTARAVQTTLEDIDTHDQQLEAVLGSVTERARDEYPTATIRVPDAEMPTVEANDALEDALWELVANACEHAGNSPRVTVGIEHRNGAVEVTIADDGPGIPDYEREILQTGEETGLEHSRGLGLWLAKWVLEAAGGELAFEVTDGTTARVRLPATVSS